MPPIERCQGLELADGFLTTIQHPAKKPIRLEIERGRGTNLTTEGTEEHGKSAEELIFCLHLCTKMRLPMGTSSANRLAEGARDGRTGQDEIDIRNRTSPKMA